MKLLGERAVAMYTTDIDAIKMAKIKEFHDKAEVKGVKPAKAAATPKAVKPSAVKKAKAASHAALVDPIDKENSPPQSAPVSSKPPTFGARKSSAASGSNKNVAAKKASVSSDASAATAEAPVAFKYSLEAATELVETVFPAEAVSQLSDSNWKNRLAAVESVHNAITSMDKDSQAEAHFRYLCNKPGFKDSNFQVLGKLMSILQYIAENWSTFDRASASLAIPGLLEKLGDIKQKKQAGDCLNAFAEKVTLAFVLSQSLESIKTQKSPKIQSDQIRWVQSSLLEFGNRGVNTKSLVNVLKICLGSSNAAVRSACVSCLGTLSMFVGPDLRFLLQDLSSSVLATIDAEFAKVASEKPPEPVRSQDTGSSGAPAALADSAEDLVPRVDIGSQVNGDIVKKLGDANWKVRKEGLDDLMAVLDAANRKIKPNLGNAVVFMCVLLTHRMTCRRSSDRA